MTTYPRTGAAAPTGRFSGPLDAFLRQAALTPGAPAVTDGPTRLTYGELAAAAHELAGRLTAAGLRPGSLAGLSVTRGWRVVAGILGIWLAGAAYVPIDPRYPRARRDYIADDARVGHLVTDGGTDGEPLAVRTTGEAGGHDVPAGTAYVIYTSGSTGRPKGVLVRHANVAALLESARTELPAGPGDVGTVFHSYCFDFSVWEIWRPLGSGGRIVFVPADTAIDPDAFAALLAAESVTLLSLVPSVFANLVGALAAAPVPLPALREVVFGGEPVDLAAVRTWYRLAPAPRARLVNMYGITETTVHVTVKELDARTAEEAAAPGRPPGTPIGRPLAHLEVAVLDPDSGEPVPPGATGEMYVAGDGVAWGYLGRPELTAARFVRLPHDAAGRRWYRTGDLARRDAGGELVFTGRADAQVQLRGHRVELGEVETTLAALPGVRGAGAVVVPNRAGEPTLVAGWVPGDPAAPEPARALRAALRERLPEHLVPTRLVPLDALPVTPEGKLDRAALTDLVRPVTGEGAHR